MDSSLPVRLLQQLKIRTALAALLIAVVSFLMQGPLYQTISAYCMWYSAGWFGNINGTPVGLYAFYCILTAVYMTYMGVGYLIAKRAKSELAFAWLNVLFSLYFTVGGYFFLFEPVSLDRVITLIIFFALGLTLLHRKLKRKDPLHG